MFTFNFLRLLRDPNAGDGGGDGSSAEALALEQALLDEGGIDAKPKEEVKDDKGAGAGDKGKGAGDKSGVEDDPEEELDSKDDKGQPTKIKVKRSELKAGYMRQQDYTQKTQKLSEIEKNQKDLIQTAEAIRQHPKLAKAFVSFVQQAITEKGYNEEFIDKQLQVLTAVAPQAGDTKKDLKDNQEDIENLLEGVDPESPIAKALKQTWKANKDMLAKLKELEDGQGKVTKAFSDKEAQEQETQYKALVETAGQKLNSKLTDMVDETKDGSLTFFTPGEKQEWRWKVVGFLRDNPVEYKDENEFLTRIADVGKAVHTAMIKYREEILAQQLVKPKTKEEPKQKENLSPDALSLEEEITRELNALEGGEAGTQK